jgi:hypothetical protein
MLHERFINLVKEFWTPIGQEERASVQFERNLKSLKLATKDWAKRKKQQLDQDIINMEALFNPSMTLIKEDFPLQQKKKPSYLWKRKEESFFKPGKKNGGKKVGHSGFIAGMRIQNFSKLMQKSGKW